MSSAQARKLLNSSTFRLAVIYMAVFSASVLAMLGFIYWSTAAYMSSQVDTTIDTQIKGLAERYETDGLRGLSAQIAERLSRQQPGDSSVYLLTDESYRPLLGNLDRWPQVQRDTSGWLNFQLGDDLGGRPHRARARAFVVGGRYRLLVGRDMYELEGVQALIRRALYWGVGITLALGLVGGTMVSRGVMRRIDSINRTSREIISGNLARRMATRGSGDEFDQLAQNLNRMLDQIVLLMDGVRRVSDNIAHDLKTPLARLRNRLESLRMEVAEENRELVEQALGEADGLLSTFNALLRIARIESEARKAGFQQLEMLSVVSDVIELYEPVAEDKDVQLRLIQGDTPELTGDRDLMFQALANLIDNAIKFTPRGGEISVRLDTSGVSVCDTGPGIPEAERERVLQRFYRLDQSRSTPGSGLGLSLVNAVATLHEMDLRFADNHPGLCVTLVFPQAVAIARA